MPNTFFNVIEIIGYIKDYMWRIAWTIRLVHNHHLYIYIYIALYTHPPTHPVAWCMPLSLSCWPCPVVQCVWLPLQCCTEYLAAVLRCCEIVVMWWAQWLDSLVHHSLCTELWMLLIGHSTPHTASWNQMWCLAVVAQVLSMTNVYNGIEANNW